MNASTLVALPLEEDEDARTGTLTRRGEWRLSGPHTVQASVEHGCETCRRSGEVTVRRERGGGYTAHAEFGDGLQLDATGETFDAVLTGVQTALDAADELAAAGE